MDSFGGAGPVGPPYDGRVEALGADLQTVRGIICCISSRPQSHCCCFTRVSRRVRALEKKKPKQMEPAGNRRRANHGSFDRRSYLIIQPSGRVLGGTGHSRRRLHNMCEQLVRHGAQSGEQENTSGSWFLLKGLMAA